MGHPIHIAPSILSADFARLADEVSAVERAGADLLHVDVMDGHFVPNLTVGPPIVESLKKVTKLPLDVHLMITNADAFISAFAAAGADYLTVHVEACPHLHRTVQSIKERGVKAGVTLNPATPLSLLQEILGDVDLLLIMSVNPGFGGQTFIPSVLKKIAEARIMLDADQQPCLARSGWRCEGGECPGHCGCRCDGARCRICHFFSSQLRGHNRRHASGWRNGRFTGVTRCGPSIGGSGGHLRTYRQSTPS